MLSCPRRPAPSQTSGTQQLRRADVKAGRSESEPASPRRTTTKPSNRVIRRNRTFGTSATNGVRRRSAGAGRPGDTSQLGGFTMRFGTKKKVAAVALAGLAVVGSAVAAYAYFTAGGTG